MRLDQQRSPISSSYFMNDILNDQKIESDKIKKKSNWHNEITFANYTY